MCLSAIKLASAEVGAAVAVCVCVHFRTVTEMVPDDFSGALIQCVLSVHLLR